MRAIYLVATVFVLLALVISVLPVATYFFGIYEKDSYHNSFAAGSTFDYVMTYSGTKQSSNSKIFLNYGLILNITTNQNGLYNASYAVYELAYSGGFNVLNSGSPIIGAKALNGSGEMDLSQNSTLIAMIFPRYGDPNTPFRVHISNISSTSAPSPNIGYPYVYQAVNAAFDYLKVGGHLVLFGFGTDSPNATEVVSNVPPLAHLGTNVSDTFFSGALFQTNDSPEQDWGGYLSYSFFISAFPVNVLLLVIAAILWVIGNRRKR